MQTLECIKYTPEYVASNALSIYKNIALLKKNNIIYYKNNKTIYSEIFLNP